MRSILIATIITLPLLVVAMLGLFFVRAQSRAHHEHHPAIKGSQVTATDSNGNEFTFSVGNAVVSGSNIAGTNLHFRIEPARDSNAVHSQTNAVTQ